MDWLLASSSSTLTPPLVLRWSGPGNVTLDANGMLINLAVVGDPILQYTGEHMMQSGIHLDRGQMTLSTKTTLSFIHRG